MQPSLHFIILLLVACCSVLNMDQAALFSSALMDSMKRDICITPDDPNVSETQSPQWLRKEQQRRGHECFSAFVKQRTAVSDEHTVHVCGRVNGIHSIPMSVGPHHKIRAQGLEEKVGRFMVTSCDIGTTQCLSLVWIDNPGWLMKWYSNFLPGHFLFTDKAKSMWLET